MTRGTDTVEEELVHRAVAQAALFGVAVVTGDTSDVGNLAAEVTLFITPVVELVHEPFEVVDHTESGTEVEVDVSVGEDDMG